VKDTANSEVATASPLTGTILLVEDEGFVREVTCEVLQSVGYRVLKAQNAKEAMRAFRQYEEEVQLLLTDVVMPGQNGRDLAQDLMAICPDLRTIFISGYPENAVTRLQGREVHYLPKPFSVESLVQKVREVLDQGGAPKREARMVKRAAGNV
jgi:two-component system cell cycle sensor histidine kinase/response regulator CckA